MPELEHANISHTSVMYRKIVASSKKYCQALLKKKNKVPHYSEINLSEDIEALIGTQINAGKQ